MRYALALKCLAAGVMRHVELVVQVVGYTKIPLVPKKGPDLITWYQKVRGLCAFVCSLCHHTHINISIHSSLFRMIMSSVMRVKFSSGMGGSSLQVRSPIRISAFNIHPILSKRNQSL